MANPRPRWLVYEATKGRVAKMGGYGAKVAVLGGYKSKVAVCLKLVRAKITCRGL